MDLHSQGPLTVSALGSISIVLSQSEGSDHVLSAEQRLSALQRFCFIEI